MPDTGGDSPSLILLSKDDGSIIGACSTIDRSILIAAPGNQPVNVDKGAADRLATTHQVGLCSFGELEPHVKGLLQYFWVSSDVPKTLPLITAIPRDSNDQS
jgi:hypothetical protein